MNYLLFPYVTIFSKFKKIIRFKDFVTTSKELKHKDVPDLKFGARWRYRVLTFLRGRWSRCSDRTTRSSVATSRSLVSVSEIKKKMNLYFR
jgi:hypothetical protein